MKLKTTFALLLFVGVGVAFYFIDRWAPGAAPPAATDTDPRAELAKLKPEDIVAIRVRRDGQDVATLDRAAAGGWVTTGNWPANPSAVTPVIDLLGSLHSRFVAHTPSDKTPGGATLTVEVRRRAEQPPLTLTFREADDAYRFVRPTHLRVNDTKAELQLAPGLIGELSRPPEHYRQRRIFPAERTVRQANPQERIERLDARELSIEQKDQTPVRLVKAKDGWELSGPSRDHLDPDASEKLLAAVADLWAEQFAQVEVAQFVGPLPAAANPLLALGGLEALSPAVSKQRAGLDEPRQTLKVVRHDGTTTTLHLGNRSRGDRPPPVPPRPGQPPPTPDSYRYAKLADSDVIFEVQDGKLNDVFVPFETLRDNRLARFAADDAEEVTVRQGGQVVRLVKDKKDSWKMLSPRETAADNEKVRDLLQKLSTLEAPQKDVLPPSLQASMAAATAAAGPSLPGLGLLVSEVMATTPRRLLGLEKPTGEVTILVREKARAEDRDRSKERTLAVRLGKAAGKLYAQADGWPRIDAAEDSLATLVEKPGFTYRGKQLFDFAAGDVAKLEVRPGAGTKGEPVVLERKGDDWALVSPLASSADAIKVNDLLDAVGKFKVLAFVADDVPKAELQNTYGLESPAWRLTFTFKDAAKAARVLLLGKPRSPEPGAFARLDGSADVFVVPADLRDRLEQPALAYLPSTLWQIAADDEVTRYQIAKAGQDPYQLVRKGDRWEVTGPFSVAAPTDVVEKLTAALQSPRVEEYKAFAPGDLKPYGLTTPVVKLTLTTKAGKEHTILLGDATKAGKPGRFAKQSAAGSVFVVSDALAKAIDQSALDFLDRGLVSVPPQLVTAVIRQRDKDVLELTRTGEAWKLTKPSDQPADEQKVPELVRMLAGLRAEKIVAYRPKDLKPFGLDTPTATVTLKAPGGDKVLLLGREEGKGERLAMVKGEPVVGVLAAPVARQLLAAAITFRDHDLIRVPDADTIQRTTGDRQVTFSRPEGTWKLTKPLAGEADHDGLEAFFGTLSPLRADELVTDSPTPAQLKEYGLDPPAERWVIGNGDERKLDLLVGGLAAGGKRRYARLGDKGVVFLLDEKLSGMVTLEYRPRALWKDLDPAQIEAVKYGYKADPFELKKAGDQWQVVGKPDAKIDASAVSDALAVLRDLKLERYVKDDKAQLKLYELDPPELVLEVTTPTGKTTLHVGGLMGKTKQRYARLPGSKAADVFLLDEASSTKLVRTLAALMKP